jgi:prevent-host-death family protein
MRSLDIDLKHGVFPISAASARLAALIRRATATGQPIAITQKGYPTGVLLPIDLFVALKRLAAQAQADHLLEGFVPDAAPADAGAIEDFLVLDEPA